jgi:hypothetical protein
VRSVQAAASPATSHSSKRSCMIRAQASRPTANAVVKQVSRGESYAVERPYPRECRRLGRLPPVFRQGVVATPCIPMLQA